MSSLAIIPVIILLWFVVIFGLYRRGDKFASLLTLIANIIIIYFAWAFYSSPDRNHLGFGVGVLAMIAYAIFAPSVAMAVGGIIDYSFKVCKKINSQQ